MENQEVRQNVVENRIFSRRNPVAAKFAGVAATIKTLGYGAAIVLALLIMASFDMEGEGVLLAFITGLSIAVTTWFACLIWEAIAEALQLLEDIKNK